jgi:hypothetical protein
MIVGAGFLAVYYQSWGGVRRFNDDFQYLSVAANLVSGNGASTSILYFDEHYATGRLPAPQTVFPCGYPLAVAAVHLLGVPLLDAGVIVSALSFLAMVPLLWWGCRLVKVGSVATHAVLFLAIANSEAWRCALSACSEALFTALLLLTAVLMMYAEVVGRGRYPFLAGICCGLSFLVRYAGGFAVAGGLCYYATQLLLQRTRRRLADLVRFAAPALGVAAWILIRNWIVTGSIKGGNTKRFDHPVGELLLQVQSSWFHLVTGANTDKSDFLHPFILGMLAIVGFGLAGFALAFVLRNRATVVSNLRTSPVGPCVFLVSLYLAGMLYAGKTTAISLVETRMFYPILPLVLLLAGSLFPRGSVPLPRLCPLTGVLLIAAAALYAGGNLVSMARARDISDYSEVVRALAEPGSDGQPLRGWVERHIPAGATLVASNGQGCGGVLQRNTIALANLHYSEQRWSEARLREVSAHYGARFLLLFSHSRDTQSLLKDSPFLEQVLRRDGPGWLTPVAGNADCRIYAIQLETTRH